MFPDQKIGVVCKFRASIYINRETHSTNCARYVLCCHPCAWFHSNIANSDIKVNCRELKWGEILKNCAIGFLLLQSSNQLLVGRQVVTETSYPTAPNA